MHAPAPLPFHTRRGALIPRRLSGALAVLVAVLTLLSSLSGALAADHITLAPTASPTGLVLRGDAILRYQVDYTARTLFIPGSKLLENTQNVFPPEVRLDPRDDGLLLAFPYPFTVSLSSDGRSLTIARVGLSQDTVGTDERVPLILPLANANPSFVAGVLTRVYGVRVEVDERQRSLLIFVKQEDWPLVKSVVAELDKPRPQVMFEAEILEVNQYMTQSLGIDYRELFSFNLTEGTPVGILKPGDFTRAPLSIKIGIDLLKTTGSATVLARPRIATMDGVEARLNATQTTPVVTSGQNGAVTVNNVTTGITLRFLPKVSPDLMTIESSLSINVSTPTGTTTQGVPQYSSREANTSVRVRNGEAIVIGGLIEKRETSATKGIPGVMDIPILGELFKTTTTDSRFTDLVIVITPQLVGQGQTPATPLVGPPNPGGGVPVAGGTPANPSSPTGSSQPSRPTNLSGSTGTPPAPPMQNPSGTPEEQQP